MNKKLTFLGTSTSVGIPVIGCECPRCLSNDPKLYRLRSSIVIETPEFTILVDSGPDLRQQALRHKLKKVDYVLYTHSHLDHIAGFDELRAFCWRREERLPIFGSAGCIADLKRMFTWAFEEDNMYQGYVRPVANIITEPFEIGDLQITPIPVEHARAETFGYKFTTKKGFSLVYMPDVKSIPRGSFDLIGQPDYFIIDCLRKEPHSSHMCLEESLEAIKISQAKQALLTHISHEMDCYEVAKTLPKNISFSCDTNSIEFS
jgi:phosphoribosyl 1,2-cyclic phosphate phosphodiesterase